MSTAADAATDILYVDFNASALNGAFTLDAGQQLLGKGVALVANSITLRNAGSRPTISNTAFGGNIITLGSGNTVRGLNTGDAGGIDITGASFGTFTANNIALGGTARPLNLATGTLAATFDSITSTSSSGGAGISIAGAAGSMTVTSGTSITNPAAQGILVGTTTANIDFGNTSITGGTSGVSLQNNSGGTRTFGTLSISTSSGAGFLHAAGGGTTTAGATLITKPAGIGIDIQSSTTLVTFGGTTVNKSASAGTGV